MFRGVRIIYTGGIIVANRLNFDFTLETQQQRSDFLNFYFTHEPFLSSPPTTAELDKGADYVLWGKNSNGQNARQEGLCELNARSKTWNAPHETESLDALIESPTFSETEARPLNSTHYYVKASQSKFDREKTLTSLAGTPEFQTLSALLARIDKTDLLVDLWAYQNGKRTTPPRQELLARFTAQEIREANEQAQKLSQFKWLKLRHELVELRRQQFAFKDNAEPSVRTNPYNLVSPLPQAPPDLNAELLVAPLGLKDTSISALAFQPLDQLNPYAFGSQGQLKNLLSAYWARQKELANAKRFFDFKDQDHLRQAFLFYAELDTARHNHPESQTTYFLETLNYYRDLAQLSDVYARVLDLKIRKFPNQKIADLVNAEFKKTYTANYISTIFCQKICAKIADAVSQHEQLILSLPVPEAFKKCSKCGCILLKSKDNFTAKSRSSDGLTSYCKTCEAIQRAKRKQENNNASSASASQKQEEEGERK